MKFFLYYQHDYDSYGFEEFEKLEDAEAFCTKILADTGNPSPSVQVVQGRRLKTRVVQVVTKVRLEP